ncbi:MAG: MopE-related protein [Saprospiraceae bacterium]
MKCSFYQRLLTFTAICLLFSMGAFAQNARPSVASSIRTGEVQQTKKLNPLPVTDLKSQPLLQGICDNDVTAPEVHCVAGNCQPDARALYLTTAYYDQPWGRYDNINAMETVFGSGNYDVYYLEYPDAVTLLSPSYKVIFLDGSEYAGPAMYDFLAANLGVLENWVAAGGALFINSCPVNTQTFIDFGFGGVSFQSQVSGYQGYVQDPGHPIFNGPFVPATGDFSGNYFAEFQYGSFSGDVGQVLILGNGVALSEKTWGNGIVYFGAFLPPSLVAPQPNAINMWQNIMTDLNAHCNAGVIVSADAGTCFAKVLDQALDATATDDCVLASLTHDFAAAPTNTTLSGAVLPAGNTLVTWTAKDEAGNTSTCETLISVREPDAPAVTCPDDISVAADAGICGAAVLFSVTATDNCSGTPNITSNPASGATFPLWATTVFVTATDESYNQSTCSFVVTVTPNPEICNGIDDDCDGWTDEDVTDENTFYLDADYDGYGNPAQTTTATGCYPPYGYSSNALDCDDANYYIRPGGYEYCNGVDDNCDGNIDEDVAPTWYADTDGDGYGDPNITQIACDAPQGFVSNNWDCTDTDAYIHPGALEDCTNLTDENCDGILGENNFSIEEIHTDVFCGSNPDGTISISITPAQNYPVILWSNGTCCTTEISNLDFGTYKVTVTNECGTSKTKTIQILPSAEPPLQLSMTGTDFICGGASDGLVNATPSDGCGGYSYQWNTGGTDASISGLTGGIYEVVVTDACGCTRAASFTVNQTEQLVLYVNNVIPLLDGTYYVDVLPYGGTSPYKFRRSTPPSGYTDWSPSNGFLGLPSDYYVFEVQDANGCTGQVEIILTPLSPNPVDTQGGTIEETAPSGAENREPAATAGSGEKAWSVSLFPNPNVGNFSVDLLQPATTEMAFGITEISGRLLLEKQIEEGSQIQAVNVESLPAGLYFLQVLSRGRVVAIEKFVKQ